MKIFATKAGDRIIKSIKTTLMSPHLARNAKEIMIKGAVSGWLIRLRCANRSGSVDQPQRLEINALRHNSPLIIFILSKIKPSYLSTPQMVSSTSYDSGSPLSRLRSQFQLCYRELSRIAHNKLRHEHPQHTFDTSALVHEVYDNMFRNEQRKFKDESHFLAIAAIVMRRILIDYARQKKRQKRGGDLLRMTYGAVVSPVETTPEEIILLDESLKKLRQMNKRQSRVVEYYFFGGYKHEEIADIMNVSIDTIRRDWRLAKAWLSSQIKK